MQFEDFRPLLNTGIVSVMRNDAHQTVLGCDNRIRCDNCPLSFPMRDCYKFRLETFPRLYKTADFRATYPELLI